jgi:hypothetical protein
MVSPDIFSIASNHLNAVYFLLRHSSRNTHTLSSRLENLVEAGFTPAEALRVSLFSYILSMAASQELARILWELSSSAPTLSAEVQELSTLIQW